MAVRLNLGSGTHPTPEDWIAIDSLPQPELVDVAAQRGLRSGILCLAFESLDGSRSSIRNFLGLCLDLPELGFA